MNPNGDGLRELKRAIEETSGRCSRETLPANAQTAHLLMLVQKGNQAALRAATLISQCLGVGDMEDFYRSTGTFLELRPQTFLQVAKDDAIPNRELGYMVTMLPLALVDDLDGQIAAVNKRIAIVGPISDASLAGIRTTVLGFLEKEQSGLRRTKADGGTGGSMAVPSFDCYGSLGTTLQEGSFSGELDCRHIHVKMVN